MHYSEIKLKIGLNEQKIPADIKWAASDSDRAQLSDCKAFSLSIWDPIESNTLGINLWTEDMTTEDMHAFYFRTLIQLTDSYYSATKNPIVKPFIKKMVEQLIQKTSEWENSK